MGEKGDLMSMGKCLICGKTTNTAFGHRVIYGRVVQIKGCYAFFENNRWKKGCCYEKAAEFGKKFADSYINTKGIKVVNCRKEKYDVYIGRGSKWGNPFRIGIDGTRAEVLKKYRNWIVNQSKLMTSLHELEGKVLGCYCKPKACHGDILKELCERGKVQMP